MSQPITFTVSDLIDQLQQFDPNAEVRLATRPSWPLEWSLSRSDLPSRSTSTASRWCTWSKAGSSATCPTPPAASSAGKPTTGPHRPTRPGRSGPHAARGARCYRGRPAAPVTSPVPPQPPAAHLPAAT